MDGKDAGRKVLVLGGCRSGKSRQALEIARSKSLRNEKLKFIATCQPLDEEMQVRVAKHRLERGPEWETIEEPLDLPGALRREDGPETLLLVDCLTLWVNNLLLQALDEQSSSKGRGVEQNVLACFQDLESCIVQAQGRLIFVSNEVGAGIVPEHPLSRQFRDLVGLLNQQVARAVSQVIWMVAGLPVEVKP